jgi:hypothetical protein
MKRPPSAAAYTLVVYRLFHGRVAAAAASY